MSAVMRQIQQSVAARLQAMPEFQSVLVVTEDNADLQTKIDEAVTRQNGLGCIVVTAKASRSYTDTTQPYYTSVMVLVRVFENVPINRRPDNPDYTTGQELAELASAYLHNWSPDGVNEVFVSQDVTMARISEQETAQGTVAWDAPVLTQGGYAVDIPTVAPCVIDASQQPITVTSLTSGASIFYTTDGSYPAPRGPTASLYTEPFTTQAGVTVRAQGFLAGYNPSGVAEAVAATGVDWTYVGNVLRYSGSAFQLKGSNEAAFHAVSLRTPQDTATLLVGDAVAETGGTALSGYTYFGKRMRVGAASMELFCNANSTWYPVMVIPWYGGDIWNLGDGNSDALGADTGSTFQFDADTRATDTGLQMYNPDEHLWYLVMPDIVMGNPTLKWTSV